MTDVLYVSPHADDVAFSVGASVLSDRARGLSVAVMTVFAIPNGTGDSVFSDHAARVEEDHSFARAADVELVNGGFLDAVVRRARYRVAPLLFVELPDDEATLVAEIQERLQRFVDERGVTRVVAPLGVGGHVDHQVVHAAARGLRGVAVSFYEDTPYVLTPYQLPRRLARLGLAPITAAVDPTLTRATRREEYDAAERTWMSAPLIVDQVPSPLRKLAVSVILSTELKWPKPSAARGLLVPRVRDLTHLVDAKLSLVDCYPSQWRFYHRTLEGWRDALAGYARALGRSALVERTWHLAPATATRHHGPAAARRDEAA